MGSNKRAIAFMVIAVTALFMAIMLLRVYSNQPLPQVAAAPVIETVPVVVAGQELSAGEALRPEQLSIVNMPKDYLPSGHFISPDGLTERVLTRSLRLNEPVLESALAPEGTASGLSALIRPGYRAMSVKVDPVVGVAGFIGPRSQVDVMGTMRRDDSPLQYTGVILQDITVLAIDQKMDETRGEPQVVSVVTLEVKPADAQKLTYASSQGALQLVLRNPGDDEVEFFDGITASDVVPVYTPPAPPRPVRKSAPTIETIRGSTVEQEAY